MAVKCTNFKNIKMVVKKMNRKLLRKVAKIHGVSVKEVREDMQYAIDHAYKNPTLRARCVNSDGEKPTPEEVIDHAVRRVKAIRGNK